mmetsp:Transcript_10190/g.19761  ORF Transcript_10190/g.19761 Transcript_10190/m.19761 type:complete len:216 (+) Transcript_10190:746-1393(+)
MTRGQGLRERSLWQRKGAKRRSRRKRSQPPPPRSNGRDGFFRSATPMRKSNSGENSSPSGTSTTTGSSPSTRLSEACSCCLRQKRERPREETSPDSSFSERSSTQWESLRKLRLTLQTRDSWMPTWPRWQSRPSKRSRKWHTRLTTSPIPTKREEKGPTRRKRKREQTRKEKELQGKVKEKHNQCLPCPKNIPMSSKEPNRSSNWASNPSESSSS